MNVQLKPCPFCGGEASVRISEDNYSGNWQYVTCIECGVDSTLFESEENAIDWWNTRTPEQETQTD